MKIIKSVFIILVIIVITVNSVFSQKGEFEYALGVAPNLTVMRDLIKEPKGGYSTGVFFKYNILDVIGISTEFEYQYLRLRRHGKKHIVFDLQKIPILFHFNLSKDFDSKHQYYFIGGYSFVRATSTRQRRRGELKWKDFEWVDKEVSFIRVGIESRMKLKNNVKVTIGSYVERSNFHKETFSELYTLHVILRVGRTFNFFKSKNGEL